MSQSKGLVILYEDLSERWIQWAKAAGLTHIGVHKIAIPGTFAMKALVDDLQWPPDDPGQGKGRHHHGI